MLSSLWDGMVPLSVWLRRDVTNMFSVWIRYNKSGINYGQVGPNSQFFLLFFLLSLSLHLQPPGLVHGHGHTAHFVSSTHASFPREWSALQRGSPRGGGQRCWGSTARSTATWLQLALVAGLYLARTVGGSRASSRASSLVYAGS